MTQMGWPGGVLANMYEVKRNIASEVSGVAGKVRELET